MARLASSEDDIPYALRTRPKLNQFQAPFWLAYQELSGSRQFTSSGVAEIPYITKIAWLDENEIIYPDDRRDYLQIISTLDSVYLEDFYKKNKVK